MPNITFFDFTPRSFEQFAQALAASVMGPGLLIFGDGPDGGREAAYDGTVPYPNTEEPWRGKITMQAKFKQRPNGDRRDATWLASQLQGEANQYAAGGRAIPDCYLLVTNVRLSGVENGGKKGESKAREARGGQQKLVEAYEKHLKPLGVKRFEVWHEEKIATLLDLCPELMRSYAGWLGNRELLATIYRTFESRVPKFGATMTLYLQRELRAQRGTRLQQAGHVGDEPTPLESVFVDLPFGMDQNGIRTLARLQEPVPLTGEDSGILRALLAAIAIKLDPETLVSTFDPSSGLAPNRHLILGGPGQGKSTVTQFLAQVMRVRLLRAEPPTSLSPDTLRTMTSIAARLTELGLPIEGVRRYPLRVDLPLFADAITKAEKTDKRLSLLEFIAEHIAAVSDTPAIDVAIVRDWLGSYPFLVMMDGLDEVPPSGARREVITAIVEFWDEVGPRNADVAMTVTTRPQGYNDDLDPDLYVRWEMVRLNAANALAYAKRVATLKLPDQDRRVLVLSRLTEAAKNEATAALMVSPLQVAILFQLVDQRGTAPTDRWTLFHEYLSVVIKREQEKIGPGGEIVREHETLIRRLLRRVGLLLHVEAERDGGANAFLARVRLEAIARDLLAEEGYEDEELARLAGAIVTAATDRLVFLEQRTEGRIEFDVRSLQEFMAAGELMMGEDGDVRARLRDIAGRTHWQHVYRIAASKAFSEPDAVKFRDSVLTINRELDDEGPGARAVRRGAAASLDLLVDGLAIRQPLLRRQLLTHALELLATGQQPEPRMITLLRSVDKVWAEELLERHLRGAAPRERKASWNVLLACIEAPGDWAEALALACWPDSLEGRLEVITCGKLPPEGSELERKFATTLPNVLPLALHAQYQSLRDRDEAESLLRRFPFLRPLLSHAAYAALEAEVLPNGTSHLRFRFSDMTGEDTEALFAVPETAPWRLFTKIFAFVQKPSVANAADFLGLLHEPDQCHLAGLIEAPWLLRCLTKLVEQGRSVTDLCSDLEAGAFGVAEDWAAAEERLTRDGVIEADLAQWRDGVLIGPDIARVGVPYPAQLSRSLRVEGEAKRVETLKDFALRTAPGITLDLMNWILGFVTSEMRTPLKLSVAEWLHIFGERKGVALEPDWLALVDDAAWEDATFTDFVAEASKSDRLRFARHPEHLRDRAKLLLQHHRREEFVSLALAMVGNNGDAILDLVAALPAGSLDLEPQNQSSRNALTALRHASIPKPVEMPDWVSQGHGTIAEHALLAVATVATLDTQLENVVSYLATAPTNKDHIRLEALRVLNIMLDRCRSDLGQAERWRALALPANLRAQMLD